MSNAPPKATPTPRPKYPLHHPNLRVVFRPCWSGDFRIERDPDDPDPVDGKSILTVEKPTASDKAKLAPFLKHAEDEGWTSNRYGEPGNTEAETTTNTARRIRAGTVHLNAPISVTGPALTKLTSSPSETWTAVRCVGGKIIVVDGTSIPDDADAEAVATVRKPERGCPEPEASSRRASQVLRTFCTAPQWAQFQREGRFRAIGNVTGRTYFVYHEDEACRRGLKRSLTVVRRSTSADTMGGGSDASWEHPICAWDATVPAEEQALSLKLAVEYNEAWLLDLATAARAHGSDAEGVGDGVDLVPTTRGRLS